MLLNVLWAGWEDPLTQTVQRVQEAFASLLDCLEAQQRLGGATSSGASAVEGETWALRSQAGEGESFVVGLAQQLLALDPGRKGRYAPLAAMASRLGAGPLLALRPGLVEEAVAAAADSTVANSVAGLLGVVWQRRRDELRTEHQQQELGHRRGEQPQHLDLHHHRRQQQVLRAPSGQAGAEAAEAAWRRWSLEPLAAALASTDERRRAGAATYLAPTLLRLEPALLPQLLRMLLKSDCGGDPAGNAAAGGGYGSAVGASNAGGALGCLGVLKAGRQLGLVSDLEDLPATGLDSVRLEGILRLAAAHPSEALR